MNIKNKLQHAAAFVAVSAMPVLAFAEDNALVNAAKTELEGAKGAVSSVGAIVIGIAASIVVVGLILKVSRKG